MSDWDFLWGLTGQELMDAMATGATYDDWAYIEEMERKEENRRKIEQQTKKQTVTQGHKKVNTALYIDGENISYKKANLIINVARKEGKLGIARVYGIQNDDATRGWSQVTNGGNIRDVRLPGPPDRNKIDSKIKKDIHGNLSRERNIDIICIATSDGGYADIIKELKNRHKRVVVIGEKKAPAKLRSAGSKFVEI